MSARHILTVAVAFAVVACGGGGSAVEDARRQVTASLVQVRQAAQAGKPKAQEVMGKLALKTDHCAALMWFEKAGAQGRGYSQLFAAVILAFRSCDRGHQGEIRAYAWLTDLAIASRHEWPEDHRLLFFKMIRTPPTSVRELDAKTAAMADALGVSRQKVLESTQRAYADSRNLYDVPDMRQWLRSRLKVSEVEAALVLRGALISK